MNSKIAILGDQHFGCRNDSAVFHEHNELFYQQFISYLKENNISHIINMGDVFDRRKYVNFQTLHRAKKYLFDPLLEAGITMDIVIGNHDCALKYTNHINSPRLLLSDYPNINIYDDPQEIELYDNKILMLPWICNDNAEQSYELIKNSTAKHVFGHLELIGFEHYVGHPSEDGEHPSLFEKYNFVFSGHFHHRSSRDNIYYVGTPSQFTWADFGDTKGFHTFDFSTNELKFIPNNNNVFEKIYYNDEKKDISDFLTFPFENYTNKFVKIVIEKKDNPFCLETLIDGLEKASAYNIQIIENLIDYDVELEFDEEESIEDTPTLIKKYVAGLDLNNNKEVENTLFLLYNEALSLEK